MLMPNIHPRPWLPSKSQQLIAKYSARTTTLSLNELVTNIAALSAANKRIHEQDCINLNPATNVMNPAAEALLSSGLGTRASLGYPGDKYEMGLEAIEELEVLAQQLSCDIFKAPYAELRVASGAMANLYVFMATTKAGDNIIVPPPQIGGHVTHHQAGAAGLYGLNIHEAPIDPKRYSVDLPALETLSRRVRPKLITLGGSLNLFAHPVAEVSAIAKRCGAQLHFDAAHLSGLIAGGAWENPLSLGADVMTMSTYKSLSGPPSGILVLNNAALAERIEAIAYPGLTANFDVAKTAALARTLVDWKACGKAYAAAMVESAAALAAALEQLGLPVYHAPGQHVATTSHQFALQAETYGGGQTLARTLSRAKLLTSGIELPQTAVANDFNGLRLGTSELVRWGMTAKDMPIIADFFKQLLIDKKPPETVGAAVSEFRSRYKQIHFTWTQTEQR